jgi:hypothetical protein
MQRRGKTAAGSQRWYCPPCGISSTRKRKDNRERTRLSLFVRWLTKTSSLTTVADRHGITTRTIQRRNEPFWLRFQEPLPPDPVHTLVLDATSVAPKMCVLLIAGDADTSAPVSWSRTERESYGSWLPFLSSMCQQGVHPAYVVCDGQRGLLKAVRAVWPDAKVQRCAIHVVRQSFGWLTRNPKTVAGQELRILTRKIMAIRTRRQKRRWIRSFRRWCRRYHTFLKERSRGPGGRWWYTHRRLRAVRSLIANSIPDLFRFVTDPSVPRTSNHVEGGINSRLKELFRSHRGLSVSRKLVLASWYLRVRQKKIPPRNVV